jgi:hypothetical protein
MLSSVLAYTGSNRKPVSFGGRGGDFFSIAVKKFQNAEELR